MSIRGTVNEGFYGSVKTVKTDTRELALGGANEAAAVLVEHRERLDTPPAFLTSVPASFFNGTVE